MCLVFVSACAGSILEPTREVPVDVPCEDAVDYHVANKNALDQRRSEAVIQENNEFIHYSEAAAGYRDYGERSRRDQLITQSGGGNNISATIIPSVEDEVMDYEEEIRGSENAGGSGDEYSAEDPVEDWLAEEGRTLKSILTEWSEKAGWRLVWKSNRNYTLTAGAMFRGRFADVSSALIRAFGRARPAPVATFYKGNRVLVVETLEDENAYE
jgi:hypothetical protein